MIVGKERSVKNLAPNKDFRWNARIVLPARVEEVYAWAPYVDTQDNAQQLHNMRISIKRLRYSMELFACCFGPPYGDFLATFEAWQQRLGDIHDCDVIEDTLTAYLTELQAEPGSQYEAHGIETLRELYRRRRAAAYATFLEEWRHALDEDLNGMLLATIEDVSPIK